MRRRHRLTVDTFPFLAVLLGAMGSLILVLLIFDYRAKMAAKARVTAEVAQRDDSARREAEVRRAELQAQEEARRLEWEAKSAALRRDLETRKQALTLAIQQSQQARQSTAQKTEAERQAIVQAQQRITEEQSRIQTLQLTQAQGQQQVKQSQTAAQQTEKTLEKMSQELVHLEQTVRDLKESRKHDPRTYSVVPYKGKQGSERRPIYVECTSRGVTYHPDRKSRTYPFTPEEIQGDLKERIERQRPTLPEDQRTLPPYLLLLVRPDGIESYYDLQAALKNESLVFGYEFIEKDWVLEFPEEPATVSAPTRERGPTSAGTGTGAVSGPAVTIGGPSPMPLAGAAGLGGVRPTGPKPIEGIAPRGVPHPELGTSAPIASRIPERTGESAGEPRTPGGAPVPGPQPEPLRRPARIIPPREWLIHVECRPDGAVLHPRNANLPLNLIEGSAATNPLRTLVTEILQRQPDPVPGKAPRKLRVRFVVLPNGGERSFHAAYPALLGLPVDMDVVRLRPEDDVRAALLGQ